MSEDLIAGLALLGCVTLVIMTVLIGHFFGRRQK
jgi:hypothetical protein